MDRLTHAVYGDGRTVDYEYDPAGNRTKMVDAGQTTFYNVDAANRLVAVGGQAIVWDENGNVQSHGTRTYRWDSQNRLLEVKDQNQNVVTQMAYDGANRRVSRLANGQKNDYVYDEHAQLARVAKESNAQRSQLYGLDGRVLWDATSDQGQLYYHQDAIGSAVAMTKTDGSLAGTRQFDAFGTPRNAPGTLPGSFWFAGEQYDPDTGLIYLRARYYDPALGRFLSVDPKIGDVRNTQSLNPYAYALNNPLRYTDPSGEIANVLIGAGVGALIGASVSIGSQLIQNGGDFSQIDVGKVAGSAASGAIQGGFAGLTLGGSLVLGAAASGAVGGLVGYETEYFGKLCVGEASRL